ncbi:hypothetical protein pb186bvf_010681 [Paramecium bursaria]
MFIQEKEKKNNQNQQLLKLRISFIIIGLIDIKTLVKTTHTICPLNSLDLKEINLKQFLRKSRQIKWQKLKTAIYNIILFMSF